MKSILIFYEGETEKNYIEGLKRLYKISKKDLKLDLRKEHISIKLVNTAFNFLTKMDYDYIFIICDREDDINKQNVLKLAEEELIQKNKKISNSKKDKIKILVSNPSFEVWLLLHLKSISCKFYNNKQLKEELGKILNINYEKNINILNNFLDISKIDNAIINSQKNNLEIEKENMEKYYYSQSDFQFLIEFIKDIVFRGL